MSFMMSASLLISILCLSGFSGARLASSSSSSRCPSSVHASKDLAELDSEMESWSLGKPSSEEALSTALSSSLFRLRAKCISSVRDTRPCG
eukprot:CAMPEP_0175706714 /NCGR_PEP_ID=MMETSP0097-20121207/38188_1 /TAXON_ID=311494 /ORGANISM="Alexandrium monilatum, Strain CCMP3105" /LENGTH=90 /DNA_ID=CAMNT_0017014069 /DNA_START=547 /DNA_END=815 /DNA_ORIENTATION=+